MHSDLRLCYQSSGRFFSSYVSRKSNKLHKDAISALLCDDAMPMSCDHYDYDRDPNEIDQALVNSRAAWPAVGPKGCHPKLHTPVARIPVRHASRVTRH